MLCNTRILVAVLVCVFIGVVSRGQSGVPTAVIGTVTYLQRVALPPDAIVEVQLQDALGETAIGAQQAGGAAKPAQASPGKEPPLAGTHWKLIEVGGMPAVAGEGENEASLVLNAEGQLAGSRGCNRLVGSYKVKKNSLRFKPAGLTKMACPDRLMKQEEGFVEVLKQTTNYHIVGDTLELRHAKDVLARLQARPQ